MSHADPLERCLYALLSFGSFHAAIGERQFDVLEHREVADKIEALENKSDLAVAHSSPLGCGELGDGSVVQEVLAFGGGVEQTKDRQEGRLAAAGRSGDRHV